jgi:hypothetical protein
MGIRAEFTDEDWKALEDGVIGAGMFVSVSEPDFTHTIGETNALATYIIGSAETSGSELVRELGNAQVNPYAFNAPAWRIEVETLKALRAAAAALATNAPDEVAAYREFVLGVADHVAQHLGGVRPGETAAIGQIREALGLQ